MDDHDVLFTILEWAWLGLIGVITWLIRKVYSLESGCGICDGTSKTRIAVISGEQQAMRSEFEKEITRNAAEHRVMISRIDAHNERVMNRLDSLLTFAKNGSK
jgi:hypothetical protein